MSGRSERTSPSGAALALCAALAAALVLGAAGIGAEQAEPRVDGEYSLVVTRDGGRTAVRWLTERRARGVLEVRRGGEVLRRDSTARSQGHVVRFPTPDGGRVTLRYGTLGAESLHETGVRLGRAAGPGEVRAEFGPRDSLWVVGDVHGQYGRLRRLLRNAGLVDGDGRWAGGRAHLVLLGDLVDRGPYVTRTLWFAYRLQAEARAAGGRVSVVLGNHEIMVLTGDHRYVSPQERLLAQRHGLSYGEIYHPRRSVLGAWLTSRPAALRVGDVLLAHGGIGPAYLDRSVGDLNDSLTAFVSEDLFEYWSDSTVEVTPRDSAAVARRIQFLFEAPSVFWYRGYARGDSAGDPLRALLRERDARLHVVAHTPVSAIRGAYGDSVVLVDLKRPASEMLLLVRDGSGYERWVYDTAGERRKLRTADG